MAIFNAQSCHEDRRLVPCIAGKSKIFSPVKLGILGAFLQAQPSPVTPQDVTRQPHQQPTHLLTTIVSNADLFRRRASLCYPAHSITLSETFTHWTTNAKTACTCCTHITTSTRWWWALCSRLLCRGQARCHCIKESLFQLCVAARHRTTASNAGVICHTPSQLTATCPLRYLAHDFRTKSTTIEIKLHDQRC